MIILFCSIYEIHHEKKKAILEKKENIPKQWQLYGFEISDKYIALKYLTNIIYDLGKKMKKQKCSKWLRWRLFTVFTIWTLPSFNARARIGPLTIRTRPIVMTRLILNTFVYICTTSFVLPAFGADTAIRTIVVDTCSIVKAREIVTFVYILEGKKWIMHLDQRKSYLVCIYLL